MIYSLFALIQKMDWKWKINTSWALREDLQSLKKYDGVFLKNENENLPNS